MRLNSCGLHAFKTKSDSKAFLGLWASGFCYFAALGLIFPFLPLLLQMSGLTYAQIGIIYMTGLVFSVLLQTPWGALADRIGRRMIIILTTIAAAIISGLYPYASSFVQFLLLGLLWYTFLAAATTVTPALAMDIAGSMTVGRRFGRYRISGSIGWIISTAAGGLIAASLGIKIIFYLAAILFLLSAIVVKVSVSDQPMIKNENRKGNSRQLVRNKNFIIFLVTIFMANISATTFSSFLSLYISKLHGSDAVVGLAFSIAAITEVPCMIYLGALSDKIGRKPLIVAALFAYPLRLFLYTIVSDPNLILPIQLLNGLTFGVLYVASVAFVSDIAPESRGTALGLYNSASSGGSAAGSTLAGVISDSYGLVGMYLFMTAFSFIPALLFAFTAKETLSNARTHGQKRTTTFARAL
jgi:MFS family permease